MSETKHLETCWQWQGDCGQKAVALVFSTMHKKFVPICGQHKNALERRKSGIKPKFKPLPPPSQKGE